MYVSACIARGRKVSGLSVRKFLSCSAEILRSGLKVTRLAFKKKLDPLLTDAATKAVRGWLYEPAAKGSRVVVKLSFGQ